MKNTATARKSPIPENRSTAFQEPWARYFPWSHLQHQRPRCWGPHPPNCSPMSPCKMQIMCCVICHVHKNINLWNQMCLLINQHATHTIRPLMVSLLRGPLQAHLICQLVQLLRHNMIRLRERSQIILSWGVKSSTAPTSPDSSRAK